MHRIKAAVVCFGGQIFFLMTISVLFMISEPVFWDQTLG